MVEALETDLRERMLSGDLAPGERLREVALAQQYGVGRNALRAAFDGLVRQGLLQKERSRGVSVKLLTPQDFIEIYEVRTALETQAVRELARRRYVPPAAQQALISLDALTADADWSLISDADLEFHGALVAGAENERLHRLHDQLQVEIRFCLIQLGPGYARSNPMADEHRILLEAIGAGRPAAAERALRQHLEGVTAWFAEAATRDSTVPGTVEPA